MEICGVSVTVIEVVFVHNFPQYEGPKTKTSAIKNLASSFSMQKHSGHRHIA